MKRRDVLKLSTASLSLLSLPSLAIENKNELANKKLIWVLLRGGMDGLHATPPLFDPQLMSLRKRLVSPIEKHALPLKSGFALHHELKFLHKLFIEKKLNTVIATATPYRERSHFSAQDLLESGLPKVERINDTLLQLPTLYQLQCVAMTTL